MLSTSRSGSASSIRILTLASSVMLNMFTRYVVPKIRHQQFRMFSVDRDKGLLLDSARKASL